MSLYGCDGTWIADTTTDIDGLYMFKNLNPGDYYVVFENPVDFEFSPQDQGTDDAVDSDANPITGKTICTTDLTWDAGLIPEPCSLTVYKYCDVPTPLSSDFECLKPIDALTMIWKGSQTIRVKAWKGNVGSTLLADIDNIAPDDEVTVSDYAGSPNDVIWEIFDTGTANKIGESKFHLSCSDQERTVLRTVEQLRATGKTTRPA